MKELDATLKVKCPRSPAARAADFDRLGTQIWNASIRLKDQSSPTLETWPQLEPQLRVLAYFLLDTAQRSYVKHGSKKSSQNLVRILKTALKAARICIASDALDLCTMLFEKMADHVEHKQDPPPEFKKDKQESEAQELIKELTADYYLLRATTSWKQNKPDTVSYWLARVLLVPSRSDMLHLAEKKADLTYEVGKSALQKKQFATAVRWLEQSYQIFEDVDPEMLSSDFCDLRLVVMLDYARALVGAGDAISLDKASSLLVTLDQEHGFKAEVHLLRLDAIYAQKPFEADQFCGVLNQIVRGAILSDGTFRSIMCQIQKLNLYNPERAGAKIQAAMTDSTPGPHSHLACQTSDLLLSRLLAQSPIVQTWIEKIVVTRVWISSLSLDVQDHPSRLGNLFDDIAHANGIKLSAEATHASQSLIWKAATALQQLQNEDEAAKWCDLASHDIFASSGDLNKAKLSRKLMTVALSKGDLTAARAAYHQMSESGKSAAMTQYLMYKIAIQENDVELATQSLGGVLKSSSKGTEKYLYGCALEAQQAGNRQQFIATMHKVLEFHEKHPLDDVRLPVLLRCIAGSIEAEVNNHDMPLDAGLTELCKVFEAAMRHGSSSKDVGNDEPRLAELRWFACHCYNTALRYCSDMQPELLTRFMMASVALIDHLRTEGDKDNGLLSRLLLCRFLATSALVVLARSEDNIERALQLYLDARRQIAAFHHKYQEALQNGSLQPDATSDIEVKEFEMVQFDLEALMRLENWHDLDKVLSMCLEARHSNRLESAADLILHIHTHIISSSVHPNTSNLLARIPSVMEKIINTCWRNNKDITRVARWIRCLFQMTLTTDSAVSLRCLDQASAIASKAATQHISEAYPSEELEWLASTAFNHAVDLWFAGAEEEAYMQEEGNEQARVWAEKALMLAGSVGGVGDGMQGLHKVLQDKWMKLKGIGQDGDR
ncbi:SPO22-domain-containing protein [Aureobasidium namibiae CBS 147.97]|uniref:SPO22-domain-containing protein n=1 Tax=Aureobasidium namibiae CBS 147.97 TaxID=1043004 RepID=A0A074WIS2_9PEZI|nr:SPO22-domain-containing protein [Aureobasidium namibiae CBS 147.97]KEQ69702.1 SPO22-domain-containing protein [Aureobasidium namibiae CBS 147.97]